MTKQLRFLSLAGILTALSIALDVLVKQVIPAADFGLPYYAIPLIIGGIVLGPIYGALMGLVSDNVGFILFVRGGYNPLFSLSAIIWGFLPGLLLNKKSSNLRIGIVLTITHILATLLNTFALYMVVSLDYAIGSLSLRLPMMPVNIAILSIVTVILNKRLMPVYEDFLLEK